MVETAPVKKQLLFVEDESYVVARVSGILEAFPQFEVTRTDNGPDARALLKERSFDIMLADIYVRGVSGIELMHHAKEKNKDCCVIFITGVDNADLAAKSLKEGAFDYVIKPPALEKLSSILKIISLLKP